MLSTYLDKFIAAGFLFVLAFTVFAHGAVESWSIAAFELFSMVLMLLWVIKLVAEKEFVLKIPPTAYPLAAFLIYGIIQSIALTGSNGETISLSQDVEMTRSTIKILFFLLVGHLISANFFVTRQRLHILANFLTAFGLFIAVFGLIQYFAGDGKIYWFRNIERWSRGVNGPFLNHNHFAGFLNLLLPIPIALLLTRIPKKSAMFFGFAAVMMGVAILASASRGGILSLGTGLVFLLIAGLYYAHRAKLSSRRFIHETGTPFMKKISWYIPTLAASLMISGAIMVGILWIGLNPVVDIFSQTVKTSEDGKSLSVEDSRFWIWQNSINIFKDNPVYGIGMGTFANVFPKYADSDKINDYDDLYIINAAHNDYLQVVTDTGLIGAGIALWFILTLGYTVMQSLRARDPFYAAIAIASGAGVCMLLIHSVFDFNLQRPSNALIFLTLTAVLPRIAATVHEPLLEFSKQLADDSDETMFALGVTTWESN